jgi:hypothetical protein
VGVISFAPRVSFPTGWSPAAVALTDLDEDGKQDILVVNMYSNSVSLFKNASVPGNVSLNDKIDFATDVQPYKLDVGDLDGDNKPDIVTGNSQNSTVSVLKNTSSGAFFSFSRQDIVIGTSPTRVAIDDVDGDGKPDIAIGGSEINIAVIKNTSEPGTITFAEKQLYYMQGSSGAITIADLDNDAKKRYSLPVLSTGFLYYGTDVRTYHNFFFAGYQEVQERL